jgi:hypothetical protein
MAVESNWKVKQFFRMWPRALFHMEDGQPLLEKALCKPGVYVLYRDEDPHSARVRDLGA